jgi:hypothetical protein
MPPDPATVAPLPANGVATIMADASGFLYRGRRQFGVGPGTIEAHCAAVVRAK